MSEQEANATTRKLSDSTGNIFPFASKKELGKFLQEYPEAKGIKKRIEKTIKRDAGRELLKLRVTNGGVTKNGDVTKIATIYQAFGFHYVTKSVVSSHATNIQKTRDLRNKPHSRAHSKNGRRIKGNHVDEEDEDEDDDEVDDEVDDEHDEEFIELSDVDESLAGPSKKRKVCHDSGNERDERNSDHIQLKSPSAASLEAEAVETIGVNSREVELPTDSLDTGLASHFDGAMPLEWNDESLDEPLVKRNRGGRPKGAKENKEKAPKVARKPNVFTSKFIQDLTTKAAQICLAARIKAKSENKTTVGTIKLAIAEVAKEAGVPLNTINRRTVANRVARNNPSGNCTSRTPILEQVEPEIIKYCVQLAKMGQALIKDQVIPLTMGLLKRMDLESVVLEMKKQRKWLDDDADDANGQQPLLGVKWFRGFMLRNQKEIVTEVGHDLPFVGRFFKLRLENFKFMYDLVYDNMVRAGVAEKYQRPVLFDVEGKRVANTEREWAYGLPTKYRVSKPQYVLFVDQLGTRDKAVHGIGNFYNHVEGQAFVLPIEANSESNEETVMKFSVFCFSDAVGETVLAAIIFMSDKDINDIPQSIRSGIDVFKPFHGGNGEVEMYERNSGPGQAMQGGPISHYCGKDIPCFVGTSKTGLLESPVLLQIFKFLDELNLYDRSSGVKPFLLLDGHEGKLDVDLLDYVQEPDHEWAISFGLHSQTHLLNVADAQEFNGTFKEEFTKMKQRLLDSRANSNPQFYPSDVVPLITHAWSSSYGLPGCGKKSITMRGWNPLNYALLLHPLLNKKEHMSERKKALSEER